MIHKLENNVLTTFFCLALFCVVSVKLLTTHFSIQHPTLLFDSFKKMRHRVGLTPPPFPYQYFPPVAFHSKDTYRQEVRRSKQTRLREKQNSRSCLSFFSSSAASYPQVPVFFFSLAVSSRAPFLALTDRSTPLSRRYRTRTKAKSSSTNEPAPAQ